MSEYFPEQKSSEERRKVKTDLSNHVTKADIKNATGVDASKFGKKVDLANLKCDNLIISKMSE